MANKEEKVKAARIRTIDLTIKNIDNQVEQDVVLVTQEIRLNAETLKQNLLLQKQQIIDEK